MASEFMNKETASIDLTPGAAESKKFSHIRTTIKAVTITALVLLGLSLFAHKIIDTDIWWHLRTGRHIVEAFSIPGFDIYSYTVGGNRWIDLHWLFQVILYGVQSKVGGYGLSLLFIFVFCSTFKILWLACPKNKSFPVTIIFFWCALMACSTRFLARPEAFTFIMIAAYMAVLSRYERGEYPKLVYLLIPLQALWTNLQGLFIIGPFLVFAFLCSAVMRPFIPWQKEESSGGNPSNMRPLLIVFIGSLIASLINPYGIEGVLFPFTLFTRVGGVQNIFARSIAEFQPPFSGYNMTGNIKWFAAFMALSATVMALNYRKLRAGHIIIFLGLAYLALNARRNIPLFVLAFLPIAATQGSELIERLGNAKNGKYFVAVERIGLALCVLMCFAFIFQIMNVISNKYYISDKRAERFGVGFKEQTYPHGAFIFLKEKGVRGPFFNNLDIGGLFIYEMYPHEKVFIDARLEVNTAEIFSEYRSAMFDANAFAQLARQYAFNAVVISHVAQDALYLMPSLYFSPEWALVYLDPLAAVFVRTDTENGPLIKEYRIDLAIDPVEPFAPNDTVNGHSPRLLRKMLAVRTKDIESQNRFNLGLVFLVTGQYERAIKEFEGGLEMMPGSPEAYYNLGLAYDRMGQIEAAMKQYSKAIEINPRHGLAHANLGRIYDVNGFGDKAEKEYKLAVKSEKNNPILYYNLGAFYCERGKFEEARSYWQRALKADPAFTPAREALQKLR